MSCYETNEAYHDYVISLSQSEEGAGALADMLFDLVELPATQAFAWLKEALADPDETLAKVMGGLEFADWLAEREGDLCDRYYEDAKLQKADTQVCPYSETTMLDGQM